MAVFRSRGTTPVVRCVDDDRDGRQEDVKVFIKKRGGNGIKFTRLGRCTVDYCEDKFISDRLKS